MVAFVVGNPSVARTPEGLAASAIVGDAAVAIPTGLAAPASIGTVPLAIPTGLDTPVSTGTVPVAIPTGLAAGSAVGNVAAAIPTGLAAGAAVGDVPVAIPTGVACGIGFGAPTILTGGFIFLPTGYAAGTGFGDVTVAIPTGVAVGVGFGGTGSTSPSGIGAAFVISGAPVAVPTGLAAGTGFGTPTVTLTVITPPTALAAPISGGLGSARWHYDELVAEWYRLRKIREELEKRQEQLARKKETQKRERRRAVVDLDAERRLDDLIIACNRAYLNLQERENEVYAGVRACLADVRAVSTENRRALRAIEASYSAMLQADDDDAILVLM